MNRDVYLCPYYNEDRVADMLRVVQGIKMDADVEIPNFGYNDDWMPLWLLASKAMHRGILPDVHGGPDDIAQEAIKAQAVYDKVVTKPPLAPTHHHSVMDTGPNMAFAETTNVIAQREQEKEAALVRSVIQHAIEENTPLSPLARSSSIADLAFRNDDQSVVSKNTLYSNVSHASSKGSRSVSSKTKNRVNPMSLSARLPHKYGAALKPIPPDPLTVEPKRKLTISQGIARLLATNPELGSAATDKGHISKRPLSGINTRRSLKKEQDSMINKILLSIGESMIKRKKTFAQYGYSLNDVSYNVCTRN